MATPQEKLRLARKHLDRVLSAWDEPTDWDHLSIYGLYCLEAAAEAAALAAGLRTTRNHAEKAANASRLHAQYGLPDVQDLMRDLNDARKAEAYGDVVAPELDAEEVAMEIEQYVAAVETLLGRLLEGAGD